MMEEFIEFVGTLWLFFMAVSVMLIMAAWMWEALRNTFDGIL
jgi:hypothetical protein